MIDLGLYFYYSLNKSLLIFIDIAGVLLGTWVFFSNPKKKQNQLFFLLTVFLLFWINGGYLFTISQNFNQALLLGRVILGEVFLSLIVVYLFLLHFPEERKSSLKFHKLLMVTVTVIFVLVVFSDIVVQSVELTDWGMNPVYNSKGKYAFYGLIIFLALLILQEVFKKYFTLSKKEKLRIQYFLVGLSLFVIMNLIFNVILPVWRNSIQYWQLGNYSAIFLLAFTAYAIVKQELFGIRVVLTALLVGLIAILILLDMVFLTQNLLAQLFKALLLVIFAYFGYLLIKSVTKEIEYRERLQKAYKDLQKLYKAKSEFISIVSHQLRTPLSAIKGYVSMLSEGTYGELPEKTEKPINNVYRANERLIKLVNDLLNLSRIEAGKIELKFNKNSLEEVINETIDSLIRQAKRKNIYIKFQKPKESLPDIIIDKGKIMEILTNLVDNAIKYTTKGGITIALKANKIEGKKNAVIKIADTGTGMTQQEIYKIFKSFSRGAAGTKLYTEGAGLGLYIAKKFVEMHNGSIKAESKGSGYGSTFTITIPFKRKKLEKIK